jgi:hypothetical protein
MRSLLKILGAVVVLAIIGVIGFFGFAPAYVESQRNAVVPHDPYPVSDAARALHDRLVVGDKSRLVLDTD